MICQNCLFPHANPLGCISCGWVYDPDYHPVLGHGPGAAATWIVSQSPEVLERMFGGQAQAKLAAAKGHIAAQPAPDAHPKPKVQPRPKAVVESIIAEPVASPFAKPSAVPEPTPTQPAPEPEPEPESEPELFANESAPPTSENPEPEIVKPATRRRTRSK